MNLEDIVLSEIRQTRKKNIALSPLYVEFRTFKLIEAESIWWEPRGAGWGKRGNVGQRVEIFNYTEKKFGWSNIHLSDHSWQNCIVHLKFVKSVYAKGKKKKENGNFVRNWVYLLEDSVVIIKICNFCQLYHKKAGKK
jgi:hypothetical protein